VASNNDPEVVPEDSERLLEFLDAVSEHIHDGIVPQGEQQAQQIWELRENVAVAAVGYGYTLKYDVSLATEHFYRIVEETRRQLDASSEISQAEKDLIRATGYGHIGDGNLHLNISVPGYENQDLNDRLTGVIEPFVMDFVR